VRSIRDWDGREWARETGRVWPDDEWYKNRPQALVWPERNTGRDEVEPDDDIINWRTAKDLVRIPQLPLRHPAVLPALKLVIHRVANRLESEPLPEGHFHRHRFLCSSAVGSQDDPILTVLPLDVPARDR
jgi:hypothetical protein